MRKSPGAPFLGGRLEAIVFLCDNGRDSTVLRASRFERLASPHFGWTKPKHLSPGSTSVIMKDRRSGHDRNSGKGEHLEDRIAHYVRHAPHQPGTYNNGRRLPWSKWERLSAIPALDKVRVLPNQEKSFELRRARYLAYRASPIYVAPVFLWTGYWSEFSLSCE